MINSLVIQIADLPVEIKCLDTSFLKKIKKHYKGFIMKTKLKPSFRFKITKNNNTERHEVINYYINKNTKDVLRMELAIAKNYNLIKVNKKRNSAVFATEKKDIPHFNLGLPFVYSILLNKNNGIELYAASIIRNKKGYLFLGLSGSGKSTIAQSVKKDIVLHDDFSVITKNKINFKIWSVPLKSDTSNIYKKNKSVELRACFRIIKSNKNRLVKLSNKAAFKCLQDATFRHRVYVNAKKEFKILASLAKKVDVYNLYFRKKCDFWGLIDEIK